MNMYAFLHFQSLSCSRSSVPKVISYWDYPIPRLPVFLLGKVKSVQGSCGKRRIYICLFCEKEGIVHFQVD